MLSLFTFKVGSMLRSAFFTVVLFFGLLVLAVMSCSKSKEEKCETEKTARIRIGNKSEGTTYTVVLDGRTLVLVDPGNSSDYLTVPAGKHKLDFMTSYNWKVNPCSFNIDLAACQDYSYNCDK